MKKALHWLLCAVALFGAASAAAFDPFNGHWWNPNESGTGYNIDVRNGVLVMTIYSYAGNGTAQWYLASGPVSADGRHFTGDLQTYTGGQCISCAYAPAQYAGSAGNVSIDFASETVATLHLPNGRATAIQPFFPSLSSTGPLDGTYRLKRATIDIPGGALLDTANGTMTVSGTMSIAGNTVKQTVTITANGTTITMSASGTFTDHGSYVMLVEQGESLRAALITRWGALLITETTAGDSIGGAEIDQWELVDRTPSMVVSADAIRSRALPGRLLGALFRTMGAR